MCCEAEAVMYVIASQHLNIFAYSQQGEPQTPSVEQLECVKASVVACTAFFETLLSVHPIEYRYHSFHTWGGFCRILTVVGRIFQTENIRDFRSQLKKVLDFDGVFERLSHSFEQAANLAKAEGLPLGDNHLLQRWSFRLRSFKETINRMNDQKTLGELTSGANLYGDNPESLSEVGKIPRSVKRAGSQTTANALKFDLSFDRWGDSLMDSGNRKQACLVQ